ncbi:MAG: chorismate-binding protein, partial [Solirubrobacteraceae bacterium]
MTGPGTTGIGGAAAGPFRLGAEARMRVADRLDQAVRRARADGRAILAGVTLPVGEPVDPTAIACASRRPGECWFCLEQPDREGFALATLGAVHTLEAHGPDRFVEVAAAWRALAADAVTDAHEGPRGAGLVAVGGFAFAPDGGSAPHWTGFPPASLAVPEVALARRAGAAWLTLAALAAPDDTPEGLLGGLERRLSELRGESLPLLDPAPTERARVAGGMPPQHYVSAVARAVERIRAGELEKVVLAREVEVHAPAPHDPGAIVGVLREAFPQCFVFAAGAGDATF